MAVTPITVFQMSAKYPSLPPTALSLDIGAGTSAAVAADGVSYVATGKEIVLVKGADAPQVVTVTSVADRYNRTGNIVYTVGTGLMSILPQIQLDGFQQSNGTVVMTLDAGGTDVLFWVIRLTD